VDVKVGSRLARLVTLSEVKRQPALKDFDLLSLA